MKSTKVQLTDTQCCGAGAGAGGAATFCWSRSQSFFGPAPGTLILIKCYKNPKFFILTHKNPKFFILKFEVDLKNLNFVAIYFKEPVDDHLCL
jgi:hypothetical protein